MTDLSIVDNGKGLAIRIRHDGQDHHFPTTDDDLEVSMYRIKAALMARQKIASREWR